MIALVLGTLVAFGIHRFRFFGRDTVSLMLVLPIALPGIVTGLALQSAFNISHIDLSIYTIIIGHSTFCMVVVFNNVVARLRRTSTSLIEASSDLGARPLQTFRLVTMPMLSTAIIAGALLAFALSFDEVIVTTFTAGRSEHAAAVDLRRHSARSAVAGGQRRRRLRPDPDRGADRVRGADIERRADHSVRDAQSSGESHAPEISDSSR